MPDEINQRLIRQDTPGLRKRWFQGETLDLSIWQPGPSGRVVRFQLIVDGERIIDYQSGRGITTGRVDSSRHPGHHSAASIFEAERDLDVATLRRAFDEFTTNPPLSQKRVLRMVVETLHAALCNPENPQFPDGNLPPGQDSVLMDMTAIVKDVPGAREAAERRGVISAFLGRFRGR